MLTRPTPARRRRRDDWHRSDGGVWLPRDPLRGAGMVRRGMGFGFEPAGCCCGEGGEYDAGCECLDAPTTLIVDLSDGEWTNGIIPVCTAFNDVWAHDRVTGNFEKPCWWQIVEPLDESDNYKYSGWMYLASSAGEYRYYYQAYINNFRGFGYYSDTRILTPEDNCFDQFAVDGRVELTKYFELGTDYYCGGTMPDTVYMTKG